MRELLGKTQHQFALQIGVSYRAYSRYENEGGEIPASALEHLARLGVSINWLLTGEGEIFTSASAERPQGIGGLSDVNANGPLLEALDQMGYVHLPHYNVDAAAGNGSISEVGQPVRTVGFSREWLHREHSANPADLILMNAKGDSGYDRIKDGDLLLIDTSEPKLRSGNQIYAFVHEGLLFVKRLERRLDGGLIVSSDNSDLFKPEHLSAERAKDLNIIGRVIWNAGRV